MHPILIQHLKRLLPHTRGDADMHTLAAEMQAFLEHYAAPPELRALAAGLLGINEELHNTLANREAAIAQLQALASRMDPPRTKADESDDLHQLIARIAALIDAQQQDHAAIRMLHADLTNQKFALDQHAIVSITDVDGNITYANDRFCEISGYRREELLGVNHRIVNSGSHPAAEFNQLWETIAAGKVWHGEIRNRKKNGDGYWVDATVVPLPGTDGAPLQYIAISTDITERKRIEHDLLLAKEAAETASLAKTEFLSTMSHELRTPMNAILGFSQLLQADNPSPSQAESVNEILRAGRHLLQLINEVLDLARVESGRLDLSPEPLLLSDVIGECVNLIQPMAEQRRIAVRSAIRCRNMTPARPCVCAVHADRLRLRQVLLNLLSNAVKYNCPEGRVDIVCDSADGQVRIAISDTGRGIAPELHPRLFKPFERLESSRYEASVEGSGIGLALSKQLIEAMGGGIGMYSAPGTGSTFWITLPKIADANGTGATPCAQPRQAGTSATASRAHTLLYVEDNPANLRLVQKIIATLPGLRLIDAVDAEIGLAQAKASLPDLILMDINLPGMNGFEALRCLRETPATRHIPVIAVSANAMQRDIERARAAGFDDYLTKPLDLQKFKESVNSLLNKA